MKPIIHFCFLIVFAAALPVVQAGTKEELQRLQSDVLALQTQIREFERSFNEKIDGLKSLVVQLNDQVAKSSLILTKVSSAIENQASDVRSTNQAALQEIRTLSGKIDDTATRVSILAQQLGELRMQSKPLNQEILQSGNVSGGGSSPADVAYNQAFTDLVQGNLDQAIQEFTAYLNSFPTGPKAAAAQYSIGEAYYNQNKWPQAIAAFTRVINDYSGEDKVASALFKRAKAELMLQERENAIADFKDLIQRFPAASEADLAKAELQKIGTSPSKPAKETRRKSR